MKSAIFQRFLQAIALYSLMISASAHSAQTDENRYEVELFIFQSFARSAWLEEFWPAEIVPVNLENSVSPFTSDTAPMDIQTVETQLNQIAARLKQSGYQILVHQAWQQTPVSRRSTQTIRLEAGDSNTLLSGTFQFAKGRYEHIHLDLEFDRTIPQAVLEEFARKQGIDDLNLMPVSWKFKLDEHRKVRADELHYFDHPLFGAIVQIRKIEASNPNTAIGTNR